MVAKNILRNPNIPAEAKGLYAYLAGFSGDSDECFPSISLICSDMAMSKDRLYKYMNILVGEGIVERKQTYNGNIKGKVIYKITDYNYIPNNRFPESTETQKKDSPVSANSGIRRVRNPEDKETNNNSFINNILNNNNNNNIVCPEPDKPAQDLSGILLPLNDKSFYDVPLDKIALWKETYPGVNVEQELKRMIAWLDSNPTRRKTKRGITKFINGWLSREQDRGGTYKNSGCSQKDSAEAVPSKYRLNIEPPECEDGPFQ